MCFLAPSLEKRNVDINFKKITSSLSKCCEIVREPIVEVVRYGKGSLSVIQWSEHSQRNNSTSHDVKIRPPKVQRIIHPIIAPPGGTKDNSKLKIVR